MAEILLNTSSASLRVFRFGLLIAVISSIVINYINESTFGSRLWSALNLTIALTNEWISCSRCFVA
jgi:hypothetical protein